MLAELAANIWTVYLETAFWLLLGLLAAGLIKSFISESSMKRWVGGRGLPSVLRAALFGAPLPLCSCGVLPAAIGLRRAGASKEATVSFLVSTPETSVDSVAVTYALMGPVMAVARPIAALVNAVGTGLLTALVDDPEQVDKTVSKDTNAKSPSSCCASSQQAPAETTSTSCCETRQAERAKSCCSEPDAVEQTSCCASSKPQQQNPGRLVMALRYAGAELLDDISKWLAVGIVLAGIMLTFIPPDWLSQWGSGLTAMLVMLVVGIPMYICAVASTPVAAGLLLAGVSPGAVLVFLLVGPATNIASFAILKRELGMKVLLVYLAGLAIFSLLMGLSLEWLLASQGIVIDARIGHEHAMLPQWLAWASAVILLLLAIKPARQRLLPGLG